MPTAYSLSLDDVEAWLTGEGHPTGRNFDAIKRYAGRTFRNARITLLPRSATCHVYEIADSTRWLTFGISDDAVAVLEHNNRILSLEEIDCIVKEHDLFGSAVKNAQEPRLILAAMLPLGTPASL